HSPPPYREGRGAATSIDQHDPLDLEGVGCEACHRMTDQGALGNAQYAIDDVLGVDGLVPRRGPWAYDGVGGMGSGNPPDDWIADPFLGSAELCGTCHDVTTPRGRPEGAAQAMGVPFIEQRP